MSVETLPDWYSDTGYDRPRPEGRYFCPIRGMTHLTDAREARKRASKSARVELIADVVRGAGGRARAGVVSGLLAPLGVGMSALGVATFVRYHGGDLLTVERGIGRNPKVFVKLTEGAN